MISLRAHAISLAAVFLALAIGVALGSGLLSNTVLSGLRDDKQQLAHQIDSLTEDKNALNQKLTAAGEFDAQLAPRMVRDALKDKSVVVFRTPDAADGDVDAIARIIGQAGGTVSGAVSMTKEFVEANSADKLLSVVNSPVVPAGKQLNTVALDQGSQAGDLLGMALLIDRNPTVPPVDDTSRNTVLTALRDTGFLSYNGHVGAANTAVIVTGGPLGDDGGNRGTTVARLAAGLAPHGSGVVLVGRDGSGSGTGPVAVVRSDAGLTAAVSTVDDADTSAGQITTVLALGELAAGGRPGQYGTGRGAASVTLPQ
ncbi:channel-forming protein [Mycobacterium sp. 852013-50091_SCH5140682]|uniref:copper transporter n=1 Tax=Mycobacterium sp. 852013-50091_SCH5140682 TaxID=1834109 RepID=UPI0007E96847|nr:copper transporter [Mycobacterium sp. 852013-50091_SCH5140682]OBC07541.1 channel-forming protein [Mycobacterium sp. 852013-50091_SCH5140682]